MLTTRQLNFNYNNKESFNFPDLETNAGDALLLLGNSGTGKTTLLHILAGLLPPNSGEVNVDGQSIYKLSSTKLDEFRGTNISVIFQKPHFIQSISAIENLVYAQSFSGNKKDRELALSIMDSLQISNLADAKTFEMSQGEQQRLSIARAMCNKPKLILADEPTSALDDKNCEIVYNILASKSKEVGAALVIVTHDQRLKDIISNTVTI